MKLWDVDSGRLLRTFAGHTDQIWSLAFSPDASLLVSGSLDRSAKLWDVATGKLIRSFEEHSDLIESVTFSPDGKLVLTAGKDEQIRVFDIVTGHLLRAFKSQAEWVYKVAISPDKRLAATGNGDKTIKVWDISSGRLVHTMKGHSRGVLSVAFSPDGKKLASGSNDGTVKLWDVASGTLLIGMVHQTGEWTKFVNSVAFSPDGSRILSCGMQVKLWNATTGKLVRTLGTLSEGAYNAVAFSPDGRTFASGMLGEVKIWDAKTGNLIRQLATGDIFTLAVAFSHQGRYLISGGDAKTVGTGEVKLWDVASGRLVKTFGPHGDGIASVAFSGDDSLILSGSKDHFVRLWDVATGALRYSFRHEDQVRSVAFIDEGRAISGANDATLRYWNLANGKAVALSVGMINGEWLTMTTEGFFDQSRREAGVSLSAVRGLEFVTLEQIHQSLYAPDLVREALQGDSNREVEAASKFVNLEKVIDSGPAPTVSFLNEDRGQPRSDVISMRAQIVNNGSGIGRIEWRANGVTVAVMEIPAGSPGASHIVDHLLALDPGENVIEVAAYNARNLLASLPAKTTIIYTGGVDAAKPSLHVLAIGIDNYIDTGGIVAGETMKSYFPPLGLAVADAKTVGVEFEKAGKGLYAEVHISTVLNDEATAAKLDNAITKIASKVHPRDTFVLFAAAHGYTVGGHFYLIPQDYQGGPEPSALAARAIDQGTIQNWIANRIKAKKALILLDTCESGALTSGYTRSRFDGPASDGAIGRLHEATGRPVLTAASLGQSALEFTQLGHGVFTSALIDSLYRGDANGDGDVSISELVAHVQQLVPLLVKDPKTQAEVIRRGSIGGTQSARFGSRGDDFSLVRRLH